MNATNRSIDVDATTEAGHRSASSNAQADAFRRLADRSLDANYRLARMIVGPDEAEDAVHDAYLAAWRAWPSLRDPDRFDAWFGRILVNTCRNRRKRVSRIRVLELPEDDARGASPFADGYVGHDRRLDLMAAFETLGPYDRVVLSLRYGRDLPVASIATMLAVPDGTVKSRLHRALHRLATALDAAARETHQ